MTAALAVAAPHTEPAIGMLGGMRCVFTRDLRIALRRRADTLAALVFFIMVASLFPLAAGADPQLLRAIAPGVVWVAALLAAHPLGLLVLGKIAAHWVSSGLLLALVSPLLALQFDLSSTATAVLFVSLLLGTPVLSLIGAIGAALTVGLRGAGVLLSLLVLPLCIPVLVFGAGSVEAHNAGLGVGGHFSLLGALLVLALVAAPLVAGAALRISVE
jgi:heme exporter protein B